MTRPLALVLFLVVTTVGITWIFWNASPSAEALQEDLENAYTAKLANSEYVEWKSLPGIPSTYQTFAEEKEIKRLRSQLASRVSLPIGVVANAIPTTAGASPEIDGRIEPNEWGYAVSIAIGVDGAETQLYLLSDGTHLYLACDVPADTTGRGYDQFRFYVQVGLTPLVVNERIHVGSGSRDRLGGIRQTNVRWKGRPPVGDNERWMKYAISDWQIYQHARGLASMGDHRQYEAVMNLEETGLHPGVPFRAWVQVETDPALDERGKFDHRIYVGQYGTEGDPRWFVIEEPSA